MTASTADRASGAADALTAGSVDWRSAAIAMLSVQVIQGFIYWGGGSRRFIYAPAKLDPSQPSWMANKLQAAMPGALVRLRSNCRLPAPPFLASVRGDRRLQRCRIDCRHCADGGAHDAACSAALRRHLDLADAAVLAGRAARASTNGRYHGWLERRHGRVVDAGRERRRSLDSAWLRRNPGLAKRMWFRWGGGSLKLPLSDAGFRKLALALRPSFSSLTSAFTIITAARC